MTSSEKKSLLHDQLSTLSQQQSNQNNSSESEWSDNGNDEANDCSSYSSSLYSNTNTEESFVNEWESFITADKKLFYVEFSPITIVKSEKTENSLSAAKNQFSRASTRRSNKISKLSRFVGKSSKNNHPSSTIDPISLPSETKVKFSETSEGEIKEISIYIDPSNRYRYGRRSTLSESMLGISISPFSDGQRMMIANFMPNFHCSDHSSIKIGDWLKSINNLEINSVNLDEILLQFCEPTEIYLKLQKISDEEPIQLNQIEFNKITDFATVSETIEKLICDGEHLTHKNDLFSLMYLTMEGLDEQGPEGQDVLYCFPEKHNNFLYASRGSFLTLNSILKSNFKTNPIITTVEYLGKQYNISYTVFNEDLLLIAVRNDILSVNELKFKTIEITHFFQFINRNLSENFYPQNLIEMNCFCKLFLLIHDHNNTVIFEKGFLEPHFVPLPKEAQLRIDDALSEMEAMDYREWNNEPLKSQREFFIIGSCLYYKSYLLASHLPPSDILDIESYLRINGLFKILNNDKNLNIKELIVWSEVYPKNYFDAKKNLASVAPPQGRWFLAVVGLSQMILAVILEFRCNDNEIENNKKIGPAPFYIEEIQDTLEHLKVGGIEKLASTWILHNRRPQINLNSTNRGYEQIEPIQPIKQKTEIISILKRRNNSSENVGGGPSSIHSQTISEDSDRKFGQNDNDNDDGDEESDSDWDGFPSDSQKSSSGYDMSEMAETLLKEVSDILPTKITAGIDNVLFHYVQIEVGEAYLLAPTNLIDNQIIKVFRKTCHLIHTVLQNTLKFRQLLSEDGPTLSTSSSTSTGTTNSHRSLVAIKEHGVLINLKNEKGELLEFWVIGRLFNSPIRELYVCHRSDVPQNLVEIAFRLSLHCAG